MKLGVLTVLFSKLRFEEVLDKVKGYGLDMIEVGTGAYPGNAHLDLDALLEDPKRAEGYMKLVESYGLRVSALSCHGNPVHPDQELARQHHEVFEKTVRLAGRLGVPVVNTFSGCPGDSPAAKYPNWVTCAWPPDYLKILDYQWNDVLVPYWRQANELCRQHNVKVALEMHPGFAVYNPETAVRLRRAAGDNIGVNLDPSHLFWQGIDIPTAVKRLGREQMIYHFHAKDTFVDKQNVAENGVLDVKGYDRLAERSWLFRSVGWGHSLTHWRGIVTALRTSGYDYVLSIEHEDALASVEEGLRKSVAFLREAILTEPPAEMWWA